MKNKSDFWQLLAAAATIVSFFTAFRLIGYKSILSIDWGILQKVGLAAIVFVLVFVLFEFLIKLIQRFRTLRIYLSTPVDYSEISELKDVFDGVDIISVDDLRPGSNISELSQIIKNCNFCIFVVGKTKSQWQIEELKIMRDLGKKIYVISMYEKIKLPKSLRGEVPLYINDKNFKKKVADIIHEYKLSLL